MSTHYLYSVIIPTFNRAHVLLEALESIVQQKVSPIQIIVVDDGSTDDTRSMISQLNFEVLYLYQENQGVAAARNRGLSWAQGKYIAFLDSDDLWLPNKLKEELALFEEFPEAEALISDSETWFEQELLFSSRFSKVGLSLSNAPQWVQEYPPLWVEISLFATCSLTLRYSSLSKLGKPYFNPQYSIFEDWDFQLRLYHHCSVLLSKKLL